MLASLLLSLLAGFLTVHAEPFVAKALGKAGTGEWLPVGPDLRVLTFGLLMLLAATLTALLGADGSAWLAAAGGLLGYFAMDIYAFSRDPHGARGDEGDDWDGEFAGPGQRRTISDHLEVQAETAMLVEAAPSAEAAPPAEQQNEDDAEATLRAVQAAIQPDRDDTKEDEK